MKIIKRDGRENEFNKEKIVIAVMKSFRSIEPEDSKESKAIANYIADTIEGRAEEHEKPYSVEEIQDMVEDLLMSSNRHDVAKAYIKYRDMRTRERMKNSDLMKKVGEKITASNVQNQNANVDEKSFGGRMGEARSVVVKEVALASLVSDMAYQNHINNEVYIHDLDSYAVGEHNCLSVPFDELLRNGFVTRQTDVRPAGSVKSALQLVAVIFQLQSLCQFGGVSATHLDWSMVPYVRKSFKKHFRDGLKYVEGIRDEEERENLINGFLKIEENPAYRKAYEFTGEELLMADKCLQEQYPKAYEYAMDMTEKEAYQAVEAMYHNLNTLQSRSGDQLPFTSINYGTCTLPEGRMVTKALLNVSIDGLGTKHRTSIFPCGIFQLMKGVNRYPGEPNYDLYKLALRSTAQRLYPNYANVDWSGNAGYDIDDPKTYFSTMGKWKCSPCKTF